ncbi:PREDICTED: carbohydrate sulfotransferase 11-like isoform X2 [Nicrophorus vespilloides]|nr:PREDICTED: carbohydrate sulfotransferase 11-like isoform X2 [Nicrophorus vespilloides]XP_017784240.1 PREDICTED: carbohydrate sulfotransferase 11-like isoform X2 [Nicrophorus vespilloides]
MRYRKKKKIAKWKAIQRCVIFFMAICVIPVVLFLVVTTDQYMRPLQPNRVAFVRPEGGRLDPARRSEKNMSLVEERLHQRKIFLKNTCAQLALNKVGNDTLHRPNPWEFLINKKHRLVWCNVFKAGSTSWMYNFNLLAGYSPQFLKKTKQVPLNLARQRYPRPSLVDLRKAFKNSLSFLIVRHPLDRLLSGYKDKIQYALPHTYHRKLGNEIIQKYRPKTGTDEKLRKQRYPSFPEFIEYVLDSAKEDQPMDMHWTPITEFCTPCQFDFTVIAHTETLQEDQEYIIHKAGLQDIIKPEWKNVGRQTVKQMENQYTQLTRAQILQLYHIYRYDFELFNYSLQGYLDVAQQDKDPADLLAAITMKDKVRPIRKRRTAVIN